MFNCLILLNSPGYTLKNTAHISIVANFANDIQPMIYAAFLLLNDAPREL